MIEILILDAADLTIRRKWPGDGEGTCHTDGNGSGRGSGSGIGSGFGSGYAGLFCSGAGLFRGGDETGYGQGHGCGYGHGYGSEGIGGNSPGFGDGTGKSVGIEGCFYDK